MTVKQISVFLENTPGKLADFTAVLSKNKIDMRALSLAEASDFGIVRIIVDDVYSAATVLRSEGYISAVTEVLAVAIPDEPGSLGHVLRTLGDHGVNVEYMYAFTTRKEGTAYMIFRVEDNQKAVEVMQQNGIHPVCQDELSRL